MPAKEEWEREREILACKQCENVFVASVGKGKTIFVYFLDTFLKCCEQNKKSDEILCQKC